MQIFYVAPFIFVALIAFVICLNRRDWQRYAYSALVAPVSFGFCSVLGLLLLALVWNFLKIKTVESVGVLLGCSAYLLCGFIGAVIGVKAVRFLEERIFRTRDAKHLVLRIVISLITVPIGFVVGLVIAETWLPPFSLEPSFIVAMFSGALVGLSTYFFAKFIQDRSDRNQQAKAVV